MGLSGQELFESLRLARCIVRRPFPTVSWLPIPSIRQTTFPALFVL